MEPAVIAALITAAVAMIIAFMGWLINHSKRRRENEIHRLEVERLETEISEAHRAAAERERAASDRRVLELWRTAFDRSAFKGPYEWHSDQERFRDSIGLVIQCLNTGLLENRKGTELGRAKPKSEIQNPEWRQAGDAVERRLNRIRQLVPRSGLPEDPATKEEIDRLREEIIDILNPMMERVGLPILPKPSEADTFEDLYE